MPPRVRLTALFAALMLVGACGVPASPAAAPVPARAAVAAPVAAPASERWFGTGETGGDRLAGVTAAAYVIADGNTGRLLAGRNIHQRRPMASTTKITTAMVALDLVPSPETVIPVPSDLTNMSLEFSQVGFKPGESLTFRDMLAGLLLVSGNDVAETFSRAFVPRNRFLELMNQKTRTLGLTDTNYVNPTGLDDPQQFSSAFDLAVLARHAVSQYPLFAATTATRHEPLPLVHDNKPVELDNFNYLLGSYPGVVGVKTGWTEPAGRCLVLAYRRDGVFLVVALLGSQNHIADGARLLDAGRAMLAPRFSPLSRFP